MRTRATMKRSERELKEASRERQRRMEPRQAGGGRERMD